MKQPDKRQIVGWTAVGLSTAITCFWAFWGIIENFHEGWFYESWLSNVGLMFAQHLSPMLIFMGVSLISILQSRVGGGLHIVFALLAAWFLWEEGWRAILGSWSRPCSNGVGKDTVQPRNANNPITGTRDPQGGSSAAPLGGDADAVTRW